MLSIPVFGSFPLPPPPPPMEKSVHLVTMMSRAPFWRRLWMPGKYHGFFQLTDFEIFFPTNLYWTWACMASTLRAVGWRWPTVPRRPRQRRQRSYLLKRPEIFRNIVFFLIMNLFFGTIIMYLHDQIRAVEEPAWLRHEGGDGGRVVGLNKTYRKKKVLKTFFVFT